MKLSFLFPLFVFQCLIWVENSSGTTLRLELRDRQAVAENELHLGDLVTAHSDVPEGLLTLPVGTAPELGRERDLSRETLTNLVHAKFDGFPIDWEGSPACKVSRPARTCGLDELRKNLLTALGKLTGSEGTAEILELPGVEPFLVPAGTNEIHYEFSPYTTTNPWSSATLRYVSEGETALVKSVRFHWSWLREVWQSARALPAGTEIQPADFKLVSVDILPLGSDIYQGATLPMESRLAGGMPAGTILSRRHYNPTLLVKRGSPINVRYSSAGILISMKGTALEDGARGVNIFVENPTSRKKFVGRIVDENTVEFVN